MNTLTFPSSGAISSDSLSGTEPMDCSEPPGPLPAFESALKKTQIDSYLMQNPTIIESEVQHEFIKLTEDNEISYIDEYKIEFVNFLIQKSSDIKIFLIDNPVCGSDFHQLHVFKQVVNAYAQQRQMDVSGFGSYASISCDKKVTNEMGKITQSQYNKLLLALTGELARAPLNTKSHEYLFDTLKRSSSISSLQRSHSTADSIALSGDCPLHYIYIQFLYQLEQHYEESTLARSSPPQYAIA